MFKLLKLYERTEYRIRDFFANVFTNSNYTFDIRDIKKLVT